MPNYFGPQRFGVDGNNLRRLADWAVDGTTPPSRSERSFTLSAGRSLVFNAVLAERVRLESWDRLLDGEIVNLDGSGSIFEIDAPTADLETRCARLDIHPTGPMWGQGASRARARVAALERDVLGHFEPVTAALEETGLEQERRSLRLKVEALEARLVSDLEVTFRLRAGAFATAVLRELVSLEDTGVTA